MLNFLSVAVNTYSGFGMPFDLNWIGNIIKWLIDGCHSIGLGIILFTLILKLITLPFDIISRVSTKKNSLKMKRMRPQLEKLQRQYANDKALYNQKMQALAHHQRLETIGTMTASIAHDFNNLLTPIMGYSIMTMEMLPPDATDLQENLMAFPPYSQHILEYWLDESMYARWKRHALVPLPFNPDECRRDILNYRNNGAASITCFATWLNGDYIRQYGSTEKIFTKYGNCHAKWMNIAICSRTSIYYRR